MSDQACQMPKRAETLVATTGRLITAGTVWLRLPVRPLSVVSCRCLRHETVRETSRMGHCFEAAFPTRQ